MDRSIPVHHGRPQPICKRERLDVYMCKTNVYIPSLTDKRILSAHNFWPNVGLGLIIAVSYRVIAWLACEIPFFGTILKGKAVEIIIDGKVKTNPLKRNHVSRHDLEEDLRLAGNVDDPAAVKLARLERSGDISVVRKPQVFSVKVENGVQTIELRIQ